MCVCCFVFLSVGFPVLLFTFFKIVFSDFQISDSDFHS